MNPSYNNTFDGFSANTGIQQPIITSNNVTERDKKKLAIVLGLIFLVIVIGMVILFTSGIFNKNGSLRNDQSNYFKLLAYGEINSEEPSDLSIGMLQDINSQNVYYSPRYNESMDEVYGYYEKLQDVLKKIDEQDLGNAFKSEEEWKEYKFLLSNSQKLLRYYFMGAILVFNNASYNYYVQNGSLDGFLSSYGDLSTQEETGLFYDLRGYINEAFEDKAEYYDKIKQEGCLESQAINYECANSFDSIDILQDNMKASIYALEPQVDNMLNIILVNGNRMDGIINGEGDAK